MANMKIKKTWKTSWKTIKFDKIFPTFPVLKIIYNFSEPLAKTSNSFRETGKIN